MHDLRWDQEAEDAATHARLKATVRVRVLTPEQLRTVEMPNLRSPEARSLDGETRDLCPYAERNDERLARIEEAIERIADKVTVLMLEREAGEAGRCLVAFWCQPALLPRTYTYQCRQPSPTPTGLLLWSMPTGMCCRHPGG